MERYRLWIEYDGGFFCGWQAQKDGLSVQAALSEALFSYCGERVVVYGAGRTDSGVHALSQTAHCDLMQKKSSTQLQAAVNFHLKQRGHKVRIIKAQETDGDFHARFSATMRHYHYLILNRAIASVLLEKRAFHISKPLDVKSMIEAASLFIGVHDFTTFRAAACQAESPVKTLSKLEVSAQDDWLVIKTSARSFLHHQIRSLVGALVAVGLGRLSVKQAGFILKAADRSLCPQLVPPHGLYLAHIDYPPPYDIKDNHFDNEEVFRGIFAAHS